MCLIFFSLNNHPNYKLAIAANRDEFYNRKTAPADFWKDHPEILGGRDLEAGGTWMGITTSGRLSLITNYRDLKNIRPNAPSRGHLVSHYLEGRAAPGDYLQEVEKSGQDYNGFNLLAGNAEEMWYCSNYKTGIEKVKHGFYGLSNHLLETPWPKIVRGKQKLQPLFATPVIDHERLLDALYDETLAPDNQLPDTGVGLERERALSAMFIKSPNYGSRCSTVITIGRNDEVNFTERVYDLSSFDYSTGRFNFTLKRN